MRGLRMDFGRAAFGPLAFALMLTSCGELPPPFGPEARSTGGRERWSTPRPLPPPRGIEAQPTLSRFRDCEELEQHIQDTAVLEMRTTLESYKKYAYQSSWGSGGGADGGASAGMGSGGGAGGGGGSAGPSQYTQTNVQTRGVDEADIVKNDGTRIFVASGKWVHLARSWPPEQLGLVTSVSIEGWVGEMFLEEKDRLVVFSSVSGPSKDYGCGTYGCYGGYTKVTVLSVAELASPKKLAEYYLPGSYISSRRIGPSVRLVLSDHLRWPAEVRTWLDYQPNRTAEDVSRAYDELIAKNETLIRAQPLSAWLVPAQVRSGESLVEVPRQCDSFFAPNGSTRLGMLTIATVHLDLPGEVGQTSVVASPGEVYASAESLYVANRHWWWWSEPGQTDYTYLHKFDIRDPYEARYAGSGAVAGHIVDQFSMDEHRGYFRVATTINTRLDNDWRMQTTNRVTVFAEQEGFLAQVGRTEDLAPGERIFSARFAGDKGYLVTFRQVDPLFTLDLRAPSAPRKVGELKVPGFSSYIHPMDDGHLLTIGVHIPEQQTTWSERSLKLSMFDVTDLAHPRETFTQKVGSWASYSEALWQHKAFNYFPERKLLAIPFVDWSYSSGDYWSSFVSELRVFEVDAVTGFKARGAISMKDLYQNAGGTYWSYWWAPYVRRSVMADDYVYAVSDAGLRVAASGSLSTPIATVTFPKAQ